MMARNWMLARWGNRSRILTLMRCLHMDVRMHQAITEGLFSLKFS